jgi:two-component system sensor histidine kinase MprB
MSLRWRIAAGLGVIAALVATAGAAAAYVSTSHQLQDGIDQSMRASAQSVQNSPDAHGDARGNGGPGAGPTVNPTSSTVPTVASTGGNENDYGHGDFTRPAGCPPAGMFQPAAAAQRLADDGTVTACIEGGPELPVDAGDRRLASYGGDTRIRTVSIDGDDYRLLTVADRDGGAYQIARSLDEVQDVLSSLRARLLVIGFAGVGAAVLLGWLMARRTVAPIEQLTATAEQIADTQDLTTPVPDAGSAEIGSLGRSFTTMVDALAESRREQQQLVSDASHELRTPLTSLRTNAELLARHDELEPDEHRAVVEALQYEVGELTALVSELVELATDRSASDEPPEPVDLADLARAVATRAEWRSARTIIVTADAADHAVLGRPQLLERAISNLVDNSVKYSPQSSPIEIAVDGTRLEVRDRGPGIAEVDQPHVFDRFYRSTGARTAPGSGLGLAIVKQTVERQGGSVWATSRAGGGAAVGFRLPATSPGALPPRDSGSAGDLTAG